MRYDHAAAGGLSAPAAIRPPPGGGAITVTNASRRLSARKVTFIPDGLQAQAGVNPLVHCGERHTAIMPREGIRAGQIIWLCACEMPKETCAHCDVDYAADNKAKIDAANADRAVAGDYGDVADDDSSEAAALDDSEATVDLSAVADAIRLGRTWSRRGSPRRD